MYTSCFYETCQAEFGGVLDFSDAGLKLCLFPAKHSHNNIITPFYLESAYQLIFPHRDGIDYSPVVGNLVGVREVSHTQSF